MSFILDPKEEEIEKNAGKGRGEKNILSTCSYTTGSVDVSQSSRLGGFVACSRSKKCQSLFEEKMAKAV